eukprot:3829768-Prymnesium_polylepis.1
MRTSAADGGGGDGVWCGRRGAMLGWVGPRGARAVRVCSPRRAGCARVQAGWALGWPGGRRGRARELRPRGICAAIDALVSRRESKLHVRALAPPPLPFLFAAVSHPERT